MADIRKLASPMSICEEDLFDVRKKIDEKKKQLKEQQKKPAPFFVGSIDVVNERISNLDSVLAIYDSKLAIESQSSFLDERRMKSTPKRLTRSARAREDNEVKKFESAFSTESADILQDTKSMKRKVFTKKSDEPQLVELQQYPGFNSASPTALPHSLETSNVIDHVINAQVDLLKKPRYKKVVEKMMYSKTQRAILQDAFWWFFLNKFHPDRDIQSKLFKRIARKYVSLLLTSPDTKFKNVFFMSYSNILSQSVYSAFCLAFPQSWRQFDDPAFKETLLSTCTMWISGIRPRPRKYEIWNYPALEPKGMRKDESMSSNKTNEKMNRNKLSPVSSGVSAKTRSSSKPLARTSVARSEAPSTIGSPGQKSTDISHRTLARISEPREDTSLTRRPSKTPRVLESCAVGRTIEFDRCVFNLHGGSPLLSEYLHQRKLNCTTGTDHLVRRTQICKYPSKTAPTFEDVIQQCGVDSKKAAIGFSKLHAENEKACNEFTQRQNEDQRIFNIKSGKLLAKPRLVRNISNLILMEMKRDPEELNLVGAAAALQVALASEAAN